MTADERPVDRQDALYVIAGHATNEEWLGFGYTGERQRASADPTTIVYADSYIADTAVERGYTPAELAEWLNSKMGRWFGDSVFGCHALTVEREIPHLPALFPSADEIRAW